MRDDSWDRVPEEVKALAIALLGLEEARKVWRRHFLAAQKKSYDRFLRGMRQPHYRGPAAPTPEKQPE